MQQGNGVSTDNFGATIGTRDTIGVQSANGVNATSGAVGGQAVLTDANGTLTGSSGPGTIIPGGLNSNNPVMVNLTTGETQTGVSATAAGMADGVLLGTIGNTQTGGVISADGTLSGTPVSYIFSCKRGTAAEPRLSSRLRVSKRSDRG